MKISAMVRKGGGTCQRNHRQGRSVSRLEVSSDLFDFKEGGRLRGCCPWLAVLAALDTNSSDHPQLAIYSFMLEAHPQATVGVKARTPDACPYVQNIIQGGVLPLPSQFAKASAIDYPSEMQDHPGNPFHCPSSPPACQHSPIILDSESFRD